MAAQASLCLTWLETLKTDFLVVRLISTLSSVSSFLKPVGLKEILLLKHYHDSRITATDRWSFFKVGLLCKRIQWEISMCSLVLVYTIHNPMSICRVATVRENYLENEFFFQVREFWFQSGKFKKNEKSRGGGGVNFRVFLKLVVFFAVLVNYNFYPLQIVYGPKHYSHYNRGLERCFIN